MSASSQGATRESNMFDWAAAHLLTRLSDEGSRDGPPRPASGRVYGFTRKWARRFCAQHASARSVCSAHCGRSLP